MDLNWNKYKLNEFAEIKDKDSVVLNLFNEAKKYNINIPDFTLKQVVFAFDRGFADGYRCYRAYALLPNNIAEKVTLVSLDFQCFSYIAYDENNNKLDESISSTYADDKNIPHIFVWFEDEDR